MKHFQENYTDSLRVFRLYLDYFQQHSPESGIYSMPVYEGYAIDVLHVPSTEPDPANTLIWQNGQHGVEGFYGNAVLSRFIENRASKIDYRNTELFIIHCINPWGMDHFRRNNRSNVDLNRNFLLDPDSGVENSPFEAMKELFTPECFQSWPGFMRRALAAVHKNGAGAFEQASSAGQSAESRSIYFSGLKLEPETETMIRLYESIFNGANRVTLLDFHTGYGKRGDVLLINSIHEKRPADQLKKDFGCKRIISSDGEQMYPIMGDVIDYTYDLIAKINPRADYYGVCVEAGTSSQSVPGLLNTLRLFINENFIRFNPDAVPDRLKRKIRKLYKNHFYPRSLRWQHKIQKKTEQAIDGILKARSFYN